MVLTFFSKKSSSSKFLPPSLKTLIQCNFDKYQKKKKAPQKMMSMTVKTTSEDGTVTTTTITIIMMMMTSKTKVQTVIVNKTVATMKNNGDDKKVDPLPDSISDKSTVSVQSNASSSTVTPATQNTGSCIPPDGINIGGVRHTSNSMQPAHYTKYGYSDNLETEEEDKKGNLGKNDNLGKKDKKDKMTFSHDDLNSVYVGLQVYTHKDVPAVIVGHSKLPSDQANTIRKITHYFR